MSALVGYDNWKLSTPPEFERTECCPACGNVEQFTGDCCGACDWHDDDEPGSFYDTTAERDMDREP